MRIIAALFLTLATPAFAEPLITCDERGCSDRLVNVPIYKRPHVNAGIYNARIVGSRPRGCPRKYCGCGLSLKLFGRIIPKLNLAWNWSKTFPRTHAAPGMVAVRRGHVMELLDHAGGNRWRVHDFNSGRGLTRIHTRSVRGYLFVDPHATEMAGVR